MVINALFKKTTITSIAEKGKVSRKFVYKQLDRAKNAIECEFSQKEPNDKVLFNLPVTKDWLKQVALELILVSHSSYQEVQEFFGDLLNTNISKGTIHNIVYSVLDKAKEITKKQDLSKVAVGAHDEIFQNGDPILVGCDANSSYCYLLELAEHRDATTWGCHLLDLSKNQNLQPKNTVADFGTGLRKGQKEAWPNTPCHGDVFHALYSSKELVFYIEDMALQCLSECISIEEKVMKPRSLKNHKEYKKLLEAWGEADEKSKKAISLADDIGTLFQWLKNDILSLVGPTFEERKRLFDFIISELKTREHIYNKIKKIRVFLENNKNDLLLFVKQIDEALITISREFSIDINIILALYRLHGKPLNSQSRWEEYASIQKALGCNFYIAECLIHEILEDTVRASSVVENLNSRLRDYFTLRKILGNDYLAILQFFLNHRRFLRSEHPDRVGKSPKELLTKEKHPHWLEMLGFTPFKRNAA